MRVLAYVLQNWKKLSEGTDVDSPIQSPERALEGSPRGGVLAGLPEE